MTRWMQILADFDGVIHYRSGDKNKIADLLSRPVLSSIEFDLTDLNCYM